MKVKVIQEHRGEGKFPEFQKGTNVQIIGSECNHYLNWFPCKIENHKTYIPSVFIENEALIRNYNPTELICNVGDILEVKEIFHAWFIAEKSCGITGWIPAEKCISL